MNEDFNWLEYAEAVEEPKAEPSRRRFLPRLPRIRIGRPSRPRLPLPNPFRPLRLSRFRRGSSPSEPLSAADLVSIQEERHESELDERLQALRTRAQEAVAPQPLADIDELLTTPELGAKPGGVISDAALSAAQQRQVEMLKDIVGGPLSAPGAGGDSGWAGAFSLDAAPRLLVAVFIALAVSLPFVSSDFAEGDLPPASFPQQRSGAIAFYDAVDNLAPNAYVLVALEYAPTAAGELDQLTALSLRHILARRAIPLIVSGNPITVARAGNLIAAINRSLPETGARLEHGSDYFILRYLPGGALGLRELRENFDDVARVSSKGVMTGLEFASLDDIPLTLLVAETVDGLRNWVEQALPAGDMPLLLATGFAAQPLAQAYADSQARILGPLVGARDAYTYGDMLEAAYADFALDSPRAGDLPQAPFDPAPAVTSQPALLEATAAPQAEVAISTATPMPTATPQPSATPTPTATPTPEPTATPELVRMVEVIDSARPVRIRRGPTTADDILQLAETGDTFVVLGENGDGSWIHIALEAGLTGWIAAFLIEERWESPQAESEPDSLDESASALRRRTVLWQAYDPQPDENAPQFARALPADEGVAWQLVINQARGDEAARLEAMTLGTLGAALMIALGNILAALRAFRGRE